MSSGFYIMLTHYVITKRPRVMPQGIFSLGLLTHAEPKKRKPRHLTWAPSLAVAPSWP
jgi:hypothetical protein